MADSYYRFFPGDYGRDTGDLSMMEDGAYRRLLDHYYSTDGQMPVEMEPLYRICRATNSPEKRAVGIVANRFFPVEGNKRCNHRADREIEERAKFLDTQREKGKSGAKKRWKSIAGAIAGAIAEPIAQALPVLKPDDSRWDSLPSPSPTFKDKERKESPETPPVAPSEKQNRHYSKQMCEDDFKAIDGECKTLIDMKCTHRKFNPHQATQKLIKKSIHPRAILWGLQHLEKHWSHIDKPWAYLSTIIGKLDFRAQEEARVKDAKAISKMWDELALKLPKTLIPNFEMPESLEPPNEADRVKKLKEQADALKGM